jgi:hypothetical protein
MAKTSDSSSSEEGNGPRKDPRDAFEDFPTEDQNAAITWFSGNSTFTCDKHADKHKHWKPLERALEAVTGINNHEMATILRTILDANKAMLSGKGRLKTAQIHTLAVEAIKAVKGVMDRPWKDSAAAWLESALQNYMPRHVSLFKKWAKQKKKRAEVAESTTTGTVVKRAKTEVPSQPSHKTLAGGHSGSQTSVVVKSKEKSLSKARPRLEQQRQGHGDAQYHMLLTDRNIEIRMAVEDKEGGTRMDYVIVGVSTVVLERARSLENAAIACQHLDYRKFCLLLEQINEDFGLDTQPKRALFPVDAAVPVETEVQFQNAVGVQHNDLLSSNFDLPIMFDIKPYQNQYRY